MSDIAKHERVNRILLGPLERPALKWLAARMPVWITPDACTCIGLLGALGIMICYVLTAASRDFLWLASLFFVVNWFGDSLDGTLARYRQIERPVYGFFLDHTVDAATEVMIFLGLGLTPYVSFIAASLALIGYLLLSVLVYVRTSAVGEFKISYGRLGPTEIRVLAIILNTIMYFGGARAISINLTRSGPFTFSPYDVMVGAIAALLLSFFLVTAVREVIELRKQAR